MEMIDLPDISETHRPKARKQYTCCECGRAIVPGERHERTRGLWEGRWETYRTCVPCVALRHELTGGKGFTFETLADVADFYGREFPPEKDTTGE